MKRATALIGVATIADIINKNIVGLTWDHPITPDDVEFIQWNPESRRLKVSLRNVGEEIAPGGTPRNYGIEDNRQFHGLNDPKREADEQAAAIHSSSASREEVSSVRGPSLSRSVLPQASDRPPGKGAGKKRHIITQAKSPSSKLPHSKPARGSRRKKIHRTKVKGGNISGGVTRSPARAATKKKNR